jgi:hypothetical protein
MLPKQPVEEIRVLLARESVRPHNGELEVRVDDAIAIGGAGRHDDVVATSAQLATDRQERLQVTRRAIRLTPSDFGADCA